MATYRPDSNTLLKSDSILEYVLETTVYPREHERLRELRLITQQHAKSYMVSSPDQMKFFSILLKMMGAKKTIEIGVFTGYSLLSTALALPADGKVVAINVNREDYELGRPVIEKAGVAHKVDFREGDGLAVLDQLLLAGGGAAAGTFDFAYADADKLQYGGYHERLLRLVRVGGVIAYDHTLWGGSVALPRDTPGSSEYDRVVRDRVMEFNAAVAADGRVEACLLPVADGVTLCRRHAGGGSGGGELRDIHNSESTKTLLKDDALYKYILNTMVYPRENEFLCELRLITKEHTFRKMASPPDEGQLLSLLLKVMGAKKTIEVGVYTGCSVLATALALPNDGKVVAIDVSREYFDLGLPVIKKAGVAHKVEFREGAAGPILDELIAAAAAGGTESFDFAFVDADKVNNVNYHDQLLRLVRVGGVLAYDNTLWGGTVAMPDGMPERDLEVRDALRAFNAKIAADPRVEPVQLPITDGITLCRRVV